MQIVPLFVAALLPCALGGAAILPVGPGKPFPTPCAALAAARSRDSIEIDGKGNYRGDVCYIHTSDLTILGVNGRPKIDGANKFTAGKKALWVIQADNTIVDNIEFTGASVPDRNGAGIRLEGRNLTIRNSYFHNNQDGILTQEANSGDILIEYSEFASNGAGDGHSHNVYINAADSFTFRYSTSHDAHVGHLLKSRASVNNILYDFIYDGVHGDASYELDFPNAGTVNILGSVVAQGLNSLNPAIISFGEEGPGSNMTQRLTMVNNTIVNRQRSGTFAKMASWIVAPAQVMNNIFAGTGMVITQQFAVMTTNLSGVNPEFVNSAAGDFRLQPNSPAVHNGTEPAPALVPLWSNYNRTCGISRATLGQIDIGAYGYGSTGGQVICSVPPSKVSELGY